MLFSEEFDKNIELRGGVFMRNYFVRDKNKFGVRIV